MIPYTIIFRFLYKQKSTGRYSSMFGNSRVEITRSISYVRNLTFATAKNVNEKTEKFGRNPALDFEETMNREVVC